MCPEPEKTRAEVDGRVLTLTNLSKVLYPRTGFTKAQVIDYYFRIAPVMLPHLAARPLTLRRYPDGVTGRHFYAKHAPGHRPDWVPTALVPSPGRAPGRAPVLHVVGGDLPTLVWAANLAALEIHTPMWRLPGAGEPDLIVFDLDPGPPATVVECCQVALLLRPLLTGAGLRPLAKTSGGKGLQVVAAVSGLASGQASDLAHDLARHLAREHPGLVVSRMTRSLRTGKVLIDWSQNSASKTTVAPYSLRAADLPTVSTPVSWEEVAGCTEPTGLVFTSGDVLERVASDGDLLAPVLTRPL